MVCHWMNGAEIYDVGVRTPPKSLKASAGLLQAAKGFGNGRSFKQELARLQDIKI